MMMNFKLSREAELFTLLMGSFLHARHAVKFYVGPVAKNKCMLSMESFVL